MIDLSHECGPFDIIGDVHGCFKELSVLLETLGYFIHYEKYKVSHPEKRKVIFLGDLVDRGPNIPEVLRLAMAMVKDGIAFCVVGNHDDKLMRKLRGNPVKITHGLDESIKQLKNEAAQFTQEVLAFIESLPSHYILDQGRLVAAHAGMKESYQGKDSKKIRAFALYGPTTGALDSFGFPERYPWAKEYCGKAMVVYGHTPVHESRWVNHAINIDNGCVFGGRLTALRYPEKVLVSVPAEKAYAKRLKDAGAFTQKDPQRQK